MNSRSHALQGSVTMVQISKDTGTSVPFTEEEKETFRAQRKE